MLVVDLALGCISKTMPQMNIMTAGLTIRAVVGVAVLVVGIVMTGRVFQGALTDAMSVVEARYASP
jgi:flagellar biosynthesis protein FliR